MAKKIRTDRAPGYQAAIEALELAKKLSRWDDKSTKTNPLLTDAQSGGTVEVLAELQDAVYMSRKRVHSECLTKQEGDFISMMQKRCENMEDPNRDFHPTTREADEIKRIRDKMMNG